MVIHADTAFKAWVEPTQNLPSHVERSERIPTGELKYYVVWIFGSGSNETYARALEAVFKDACNWDENKAHDTGQKVYNRLNQNFVDANGRQKQ